MIKHLKTNTNINYKTIHNQFKMNGLSYNLDSLKATASFFIKNGEPYQQQAGTFILDWLDDQLFIQLKTSGTTGKPKTIEISKNAMVNSALATAQFFNLKASDTVLHCLPTQFIAGKMMLVRAFILGFDLDFVAPTANPLEKNKKIYDFAAIVPMQAENSLNHLIRIKKLIIGGSGISPNLEKSLLKIDSEIYETFGMTETVTHIAAKKIGTKIFSVLPNINITFDDRNCLVIDAPLLNPNKIITNDIIEIVNENQFIYKGRADNVINSGGIKLHPEQIEAKLIDKIKSRFIIAGKKDDLLGEKVVLIIESDPFVVDEIIFESLEKYEKPKEIIFINQFKETLTSKIIRRDFF